MGWKRTPLTNCNEKAIGDSDASAQITLPQANISAIHLRLSGTGGAGTPAVDALLSNVKIKTDKGYIWDMDAADMHILARKISGRKPTITNATGAYTEVCHSIYFGRKVKDKALILPLVGNSVRQMEITFGTLIAATAWATTTVKLTVVIDEWVGDLTSEWRGYLTAKTAEGVAKATGTGLTSFDLFKGNKLAALLINVGTITTIADMEVTDSKGSISFGKVKFRDLLNINNAESNPDTAETLYALWSFFDFEDILGDLPNLGLLSDPILNVDRGTTTSTLKAIQRELYS